jgi:hypothetical protein
MQKILGLLVIASVLSLFVLIFYIFRESKKTSKYKDRKRKQTIPYLKSKKRAPHVSLPKLQKKLFSMVGNRSVAIRLVDSIRAKNAHRDEAWCWEKAILDLERDRRY